MLNLILIFYAFDYYVDHIQYMNYNQLVNIFNKNLYLVNYDMGIVYKYINILFYD